MTARGQTSAAPAPGPGDCPGAGSRSVPGEGSRPRGPEGRSRSRSQAGSRAGTRLGRGRGRGRRSAGPGRCRSGDTHRLAVLQGSLAAAGAVRAAGPALAVPAGQGLAEVEEGGGPGALLAPIRCSTHAHASTRPPPPPHWARPAEPPEPPAPPAGSLAAARRGAVRCGAVRGGRRAGLRAGAREPAGRAAAWPQPRPGRAERAGLSAPGRQQRAAPGGARRAGCRRPCSAGRRAQLCSAARLAAASASRPEARGLRAALAGSRAGRTDAVAAPRPDRTGMLMPCTRPAPGGAHASPAASSTAAAAPPHLLRREQRPRALPTPGRGQSCKVSTCG